MFSYASYTFNLGDFTTCLVHFVSQIQGWKRRVLYVLPDSNLKLWTNWDVLLKSCDLSDAIFLPLKFSVLVLNKSYWLSLVFAEVLSKVTIYSVHSPHRQKTNEQINHRIWCHQDGCQPDSWPPRFHLAYNMVCVYILN